MISRLWFLASILPCLGHDVDLPGCPFETLTGKCKGEATCHSLAHSGLTCEGLVNIVECATFCAYPCCSSATSSTATTSITSHTHTSTATETTETTTSSSITSKTLTTSSLSSSTTTSHHPDTTEMLPTSAPGESSGPESTLGPAAVMRISMRVEVTDPQNYLEYFDDQVVREAYINVMSEVASVPSDLVDLERTSSQLGYLTMTYVITIPYTSEDTPSIPLTSVQEKLSTIDIPTFNELLDAEMRQVAGGTFKQKVVSVTVADDDISVNRAPLAALAVLAMLSQAVVVI